MKEVFQVHIVMNINNSPPTTSFTLRRYIMSQIVTRKGPVKEDKEKRQTDSPVKEMKKKIAANAEKEKQAAEKNAEKPVQSEKKHEKAKENTDKPVEKPADKKDKQEKSADKSGEKKDKVEKSDKKESSDKKETKEDKPAEKKEKPAEKKEVAQPEKSNDNNKEKGGKAELPDDKQKKPEQKARENGAKVTNGEQNGDTVSSDEDLQSDVERDEMFPELAYEDSDGEYFEPPTPEGLPSRSYTRRSQVKATRTPETPRPASDKRDRDYVPDDSKLLKMKDDTPSSDRKLRSADSPKPQDKKIEKVQDKKSESPKKDTLKAVQEEQKEESEKDANERQKNEVEIEVVVEVENEDETRVKADTNFSKSRVKVSPYRRSARVADVDVSLVANYTGNNTTMEMDITESSSFMTEETPESPYLSGLRSIRGRRSYKPLKEMKRNFGVNWITRPTTTSVSEQHSRPTGTVVGRKRKPDADEAEADREAEAEREAEVEVGVEAEERRGGKRARLLDRLARPFRAASTPLVARRNAEIVGINTDLPLTAPVAGPDPFDPEAIKPPMPLTVPHVTLTPPHGGPAGTAAERDAKRCVLIVGELLEKYVPTSTEKTMGWHTALFLLAAVQLSAQYLLPGDVTPSHYDVRLIYDIDPKSNFSFFGVVDILITPKQNTPKIVLHAQDFSIDEDRITVVGPDESPKVNDVKYNETLNFVVIFLSEELKENEIYKLTIPFSGNLVKGLDGAYISTYTNKKNQKTEYLISTQFEAISARKAFPCFDEPIYKATFSINVAHHRDYTAVSNMPLLSSSDTNALEEHWPWQSIGEKFKKDKSLFKWDQFDKSLPMSTYLVAYVVSTFAYVESPPELSHTKFRIWARSDAIDQTSYAAQIGPKVLSHFEKWFNVPFPLPKQDMIAIPDFAAGAMENWGLITYRETALLYDKKESSFLNKERVAEVVAHELAHQWFGNLVTMNWWSDLWLNEGFATFMGTVGMAAVEPEWRVEVNKGIDDILSVLSLDALESSHPVSMPLDDPKRISEIFDTISYLKGAALIRMMRMFLGEDVFRKALHNYLMKYSYSNAEQDDLWAELTAVNRQYDGLSRNVTVKQVMDTWTKQTGFPLLTVNRDYADNSLTLSQKRYFSLSPSTRTTSSWWVPLSVLCQKEDPSSQQVQWLGENEGVGQEHRFEHGAGPDEWVLFNYNMIAPYRVQYDERNWKLLTKTLTSDRYTTIPMEGRVQLLSDAFALAWNNELDYGTTMELASYLRRETEYAPLSTGVDALGKIENVLKRTADYGAFQKFMRRLISNAYEKAGGLSVKKIVNGDDLNSVKMQVLTSSWACRVKVAGCEENAMQMFQQWMDTENPDENNPIPVDLRRTVYCVALARGGVREWRFALARRRNSNVAAARNQLLYALACSRDVWILAQYLEWTVTDGSEIRRQDGGSVISSVVHSTVGYYVAKDFIYNRIEDLHNAFRGQNRVMGRILKALLNQFTTDKELNEFLEWKENNAKYLSESKIAVSQGIENARLNIAWLKKNKKTVVDKLRQYSLPPSPYVAPWKSRPVFLSALYAIHNITRMKLKKYVFR
ncbi:unnamed protein product, partial [Brenthis ino]